jgi:hypothetical protein
MARLATCWWRLEMGWLTMRRKPGSGIHELARAEYQTRMIELINDLLDYPAGFTRVDIEIIQHRGDLGHEKTNEISSHYALVKVNGRREQETNWATLALIQEIAAEHDAKVSVDRDGAIVLWLTGPKAGDDNES